MTPMFMKCYLESEKRQRKDLWIMNPNKLTAVEFLVKYWEDQDHKIIVFSDDLRPVVAYSHRMGRHCLTGSDDSAKREEILGKFRDPSSDVKTIFMSSVGDAAIDLPDASVIVQISSNFGSRQKEAQRLGRILRPKPNSNAAFNAHFYTLVSKDTQEMYFSTKRQRYLVDQGYAFKVVTRLDHDGHDLFTMNAGQLLGLPVTFVGPTEPPETALSISGKPWQGFNGSNSHNF
ncbi:P-loop containing nucleoside triphosphate hydrolase protein [Baffinella frigidus]|nr:P-loop containing nucleoside triphosphate hydrolase protein [Cryptophyta sp. CCMP2293]